MAQHLQIIFLDLVLLVLLDNEAEVLNLPLHWLIQRARLDHHGGPTLTPI